MARVVMLIHEENGAFGASFPDFPGATTVASDIDALFAKAVGMLEFHVSGMIEDGEDLPELRSLRAILDDPSIAEERRDAILTLVDVELPGRTVRVNITLDESVLRRIDRAAEAAGESRSGFLVSAAKARMVTSTAV